MKMRTNIIMAAAIICMALLSGSCVVYRDHPHPPKKHHKKPKHHHPHKPHKPHRHPHAATDKTYGDGTFYYAAWYATGGDTDNA